MDAKKNTTTVRYEVRELANTLTAEGVIESQGLESATTQLTPEQELHAPDIRLAVETLSFDQLTDLLIELEYEQELSTLEMFRRYIRSEEQQTEVIERWFDLFFLYLGTQEVRRHSRP